MVERPLNRVDGLGVEVERRPVEVHLGEDALLAIDGRVHDDEVLARRAAEVDAAGGKRIAGKAQAGVGADQLAASD